ncbi:hypothetical protein [Caldalkalibacillus mannanilyticus]|uniref:hypothetical protein n=1 Tax=Caldalkalibacillus mannanilyticus TaxID=1418 RepID=UPI0004693F7D|nr:hypothetical protein [Caldalkalibacillus mannanilyticus]
MNFKKKLVASILSTSMIVSGFSVALPASFGSSSTYVSANQHKVDAVADFLIEIHGMLNADERKAISDARDKLNDLTADDWTQILGSATIAKVDAQIGVGKTVEISKGIASIIYGPSVSLKADIAKFRTDYKDDFDTVFGTERTVEKMFEFMFTFSEKLNEAAISGMISGSQQPYQNILNKAIQETKKEHPEFSKALTTGTGLTVEELLGDVRDRLEAKVDSNKEAKNSFTV